MLTENRLKFLKTLHSMSLLNISALLTNTSQSEYFVMAAIYSLDKEHSDKQECCTGGVSAIADELSISSPAVSRTVTSLENRGYARRFADKSNRRSTMVHLTELGESVYKSECKSLERFIDNVLARMGEERINELLALMGELLSCVDCELTNRR